MRAIGLVLLAAAACAGGAKKPAGSGQADAPAVAERRTAGASGEPSDACREAYQGYVAAWSDWFDTELDSDAQAAIIAEFGQELPRRAALEEMRVTADELRYEPGFELWIRALTATEEAIESCGEGAPRPS